MTNVALGPADYSKSKVDPIQRALGFNHALVGLFIVHCIALHIVYYTSNIGIGQEPDGEAEGQVLAMNLF